MADLTETLQKLEALQATYASRDAATGEPIAEDLVVTLDIGSTFTRCTFAFQTQDECLDIYVCNFQNEITGSSDTKAPTSVLVNEEGRFVSFGYAARKDYADFGRGKGYYMFEAFYSMLHEHKVRFICLTRLSRKHSMSISWYLATAYRTFGLVLKYI